MIEVMRISTQNDLLKQDIILLNKRIAELESREQHLLGVIFSVSKVSFEAGAIHQGNDLHSDSIWFARKMHTKHNGA
jgi:hypothetical protein